MIIGVTGGVGSGKSTVLKILEEEYDAVIIIADDISRELMLPGKACYMAAVSYFGPEILKDGPDSEIDRNKLAQIVFHEEEKRLALNRMNHPLVREEIQALIRQYTEEGRSLIVIESAILIQVGYLDMIDELWVVVADYHLRTERLKKSRGYSPEKIDSIVSSQLSDEQMKEYADYVIDNSGSLEYTRSQIRDHLGVPKEGSGHA